MAGGGGQGQARAQVGTERAGGPGGRAAEFGVCYKWDEKTQEGLGKGVPEKVLLLTSGGRQGRRGGTLSPRQVPRAAEVALAGGVDEAARGAPFQWSARAARRAGGVFTGPGTEPWARPRTDTGRGAPSAGRGSGQLATTAREPRGTEFPRCPPSAFCFLSVCSLNRSSSCGGTHGGPVALGQKGGAGVFGPLGAPCLPAALRCPGGTAGAGTSPSRPQAGQGVAFHVVGQGGRGCEHGP